MKKAFIRLLIASILFITATDAAFSQSQTNTAQEDISKVFVREEVKPSFTKGEDSLNNYLTQNVNASNISKNENCTLKFIVSSKGNIYEVTNVSGNPGFVEELKRTLLKSSGQWSSGLQNGHHINAYCILKVTLGKNRIKAVIQ